MDEQKIKVTDRLRGLCSRREYCVEDVRQKALKALDGDAASAAEVVEILVKEKYVDDLRYASAFARDKSSIQGWGEVKIRYMLSAKKVSREIIDQALDEIDTERASSKLQKLLEAKYRSLREDPHCRLKLFRFALGRGYSYDEVNATINSLLKS
jgi:regulatory protein